MKQLSLNARVRHRVVDTEGVLVHLENDRVIVVNEVGMHIVQQLASPRTREELIDTITSHFDINAAQAGLDLDEYLAELDKEQALEYHHVSD